MTNRCYILIILVVSNLVMFNSYASAEFQIKIFQPRKHLPVKTKSLDLRPMNRWLGSFKRTEITRNHSDGVLRFTVNNDQYGFRVGSKENNSHSTHHAIIAGCSFVFGDGVKDEETFPAKISLLLKNHQVYNTGVMGGSPQEHLYLWRNFDLKPLVSQSNGFMYYNLMTDHFDRISHSWRYLSWISNESPIWTHDPNTHDFKFDKIIGETLSWKFMQVLKYLKLDYWWLRGTSHFTYYALKNSDDLMIDYLVALKAEYIKQYPRGRFIVGKAPLLPTLPLEILAKEQAFLKKLADKKIEYIDVAAFEKKLLSKHERDSWFFKGDGHPNASYYQEQAKFLAPILGNLK